MPDTVLLPGIPEPLYRLLKESPWSEVPITCPSSATTALQESSSPAALRLGQRRSREQSTSAREDGQRQRQRSSTHFLNRMLSRRSLALASPDSSEEAEEEASERQQVGKALPLQSLQPHDSKGTEGDAPFSKACCASVKVVCHLDEGVAVLISNGYMAFYVGYLSISDLCATLQRTFPSVALPITEVLARLEQCSAEAGGMKLEARDRACLAYFSGTDAEAFSVRLPPSHTDAAVSGIDAYLHTTLRVLEKYSITLSLHIPCIVPLHEPAAASLTLFHTMIYEPLHAQLLTLSEVVLMLSGQQRQSATTVGNSEASARVTTPAAIVSTMRSVFQERYLDGVRAVVAANAMHEEDGTFSERPCASLTEVAGAVRRDHEQVAARLLRSLQPPPSLEAFLSMSVDILRLARGEPNRLLSDGVTDAMMTASADGRGVATSAKSEKLNDGSLEKTATTTRAGSGQSHSEVPASFSSAQDGINGSTALTTMVAAAGVSTVASPKAVDDAAAVVAHRRARKVRKLLS